MGSKGGKSPDYNKVAQTQGQEERNTALFNAGLNRPTQQGPLGNVTWRLRPGADPLNPQPGDYIQTSTLSADQQRILDAQERNALQSGALVSQAGGAAQAQIGARPDLSGLPALQGAPGTVAQTARAGAPATSVPQAGPLQTSFSPQANVRLTSSAQAGAPVTSVGAENIQRNLSSDNLPDLTNSYADARSRVEQALMQRQEPGLSQSEEAARVRLLNSGIEKGTDAWNREMQRLDTARNDAQIAAILAGGQEQSRLAGLESAARGQLFGERTTQGQFANQASAQALQQGLARGAFANDAAAQTYGQQMGLDTFANQSQGQQFAQAHQQALFGNQAQGQQFQQGLAGAEFRNQAQAQTFDQLFAQDQVRNTLGREDARLNNAARGQGFQEQSYLQNLPIQQYLQLFQTGAGQGGPAAGNAFDMPSFLQSGAAPTDYMGAASQAGRDAQARADREAQSTNSTIGAIATVAAAYF